MNHTVRAARRILTLGLAMIAGAWPELSRAEGRPGPNSASAELAAELVRASEAPGGICAVVGAPDAELALALAGQGVFAVHGLCLDQALCERMRKALRARGGTGAVSVDTLAGGGLPYAENLINILVVDSYPALAERGLSPTEAIRVLAPLGLGCLGSSSPAEAAPGWADRAADQLRSLGMTAIGVRKTGGVWVFFRKPWPKEIDEWGHYLHGADGNAVAQDRVAGPPKHLQWTGDPLHMKSHETDSSVRTLVTAQGRLFDIEDQSPNSLEGDTLPDKWFLVARDAFNGVPLWKRPMPQWGWREWKKSWFLPRPGDIPLNITKRLVAAADKVYVTLGYRAAVSELDAKTGKTLQTYAGTEGTGEILYLNGTLILSVLSGDRLRVMAVDAASGKQLWVTKNAYAGSTVDYYKQTVKAAEFPLMKIEPALNIATDGQVAAFLDGPDIVCLDHRTGAEKWRVKFPLDPLDLKAGGIDTQGNLWIGTMIVADGVVIHASPGKLAAFAADTGQPLWSQPKKYIGHLWYEWKEVFVIDGLVWTWSAEMGRAAIGLNARKAAAVAQWPLTVNGYDLHSGALKKQVATGSALAANHHHRCYRDKATVRYILASRRGSEYINLEGGPHTIDNWARGICHVGMMPANGLQYCPPHACQCYIEEKLIGMNALAPEVPSPYARKFTPAATPALERGPAYGQTSGGPEAGAEDWPAYRGGAARDGFANTTIADDLKPLWQVKAGVKISAPVVAGGRLYAALVDEHTVVCLDGKDGARLWEFTAGARIDSPPTYAQGAVVFGCADGWVYCLRAADGQLAWRFQAAPDERLVGAFGQLESAWPVPGSVLVKNGVAYFVAGRSTHLDGGIWVYGVELAGGKLLHQAKLEGPSYTTENLELNNLPPQGALPDILQAEGDAIYMRNVAFNEKLERREEKPGLNAPAGFLDGTFFKRSPWMFNGNYANVIVHDAQSAYCLRMFDSLQALTPTVFFKPGAQGYQLFSMPAQASGAPRGKGARRGTVPALAKQGWAQRIPLRGRALALAGERLFVAGPPDVVDPADPLGAFEGRKGGVLCAFDTAAGAKRAELTLSSPPVFNGIAAANKRLYLTLEDGSVACFGR